MSFCIRDRHTGEYWRSGGGKTAWGTGTAAKQAYAASHSDRLDVSKSHELVDMTQVGIQPYKACLQLLLDGQTDAAIQEAKYLLGVEKRTEQI